jgi:hypothetical protein
MPRHIVLTFGERDRQLLAKLFRLLGTDNLHERATATACWLALARAGPTCPPYSTTAINADIGGCACSASGARAKTEITDQVRQEPFWHQAHTAALDRIDHGN